MSTRTDDTPPPSPTRSGSTRHYTIQTPAQLQLVGPSQCGKSTKLLQLVEHDRALFDRPFDRIIYACPGVEGRSDYVQSLKQICTRAGKQLQIASVVPSAEEIAPQGNARAHTLLVLDDLTCFPDLSALPVLSSMSAHHDGFSIVYCLQNPFQRSAKFDLTTVGRNLTGRFVFYQTNDWRLYSLLNSALFPDHRGFLTDCLLQAKEDGHNYVFVNTHSHAPIPRRYMCCTAVVPGESTHANGSPTFFDLYSQAWRRK